MIARHWPNAPALLADAGVEPWGPINEVYDMHEGRRRARAGSRGTGSRAFLDALRDGRDSL